ncbi:MAG TPA: peptidoglycan-binding protein [Acidimicrobiales bacterium]|nr:peptidoglycan-binding protein [Acidimicrobiales bacterium]|tara:strand:- start:4016 stop:5026 length:1011 start_codon:yes stop_codon:yes gene_type:complete
MTDKPESQDSSLSFGTSGDQVRDLHQRLIQAGYSLSKDEFENYFFGKETQLVIRNFQVTRRLKEDGIVGYQTLSAIIEAGFQLGDRLLYLHVPMFRGDDIADLQLQLNSLGFDAGQVDGIFGPDTSKALIEFQHNIGLTADGISGIETVQEIRQLAGRSTGLTPVAQVRELEKLRHSRPDLEGRRVAVGHFGDCGALAAALTRMLRKRGANVAALDHPDETKQAEISNRFDAEMYIGLKIENDSYSNISYFETKGFHSEGGIRLATRCAQVLSITNQESIRTSGMTLPVLRRTKMPAVLCSLSPPSIVVELNAEIATSLSDAIVAWLVDPTADSIT